MLLATATLWQRDIVRFYRQRSRIVGALGTPVVFWLLLGSGLGRSFRPEAASAPPAAGYLEYFFPGTLVLIVLFTAIFSTISAIEDRQEGFLQGVLVAPVPRAAIAVSKMLAGTTLALMQGGLFLALAPLAGVPVRWAALPEIAALVALIAFALTGLGLVLAWSLSSTQGFHAVMNLLLIPMWLLSSAVFPAAGAAGWIRAIMTMNPLTYGVSALRLAMTGQPLPGDPPLSVALPVTGAFAVAMLVAATLVVRRAH